MTTHQPYQHSGVIPALGIPVMLFAGMAAGILLGPIYSVAIFYIPFIYLNFLLTFLLGGGIGFMVLFGARLGHVRNVWVAGLMGAIAGVMAYYFSLVAWIYVLSDFQEMYLAPGIILEIIANVAEKGAWDLFGSTPKGVFLYIIWGIEAILIIGTAAVLPAALLGDSPYCEQCRKWLGKAAESRKLALPEDVDAFGARIDEAQYDGLLDLQVLSEPSSTFLQVSLHQCSSCSTMNLLTIDLVKMVPGDGGKEEPQKTTLVSMIHVDDDFVGKLKSQFF